MASRVGERVHHRGTEGTEESPRRQIPRVLLLGGPLCPLCLCGELFRLDAPPRRGYFSADSRAHESSTEGRQAMPRARWAGGVAVAAALAAVGCLSLPKAPTSAGWLDPYNVFGTSAPAGKVFLQTTLIDQPAGDPYLTRELWAASGKPVPPERAALLAENGVRIGRIVGTPPAEFLKLVTSEQSTIRPTQSTCSPG